VYINSEDGDSSEA